MEVSDEITDIKAALIDAGVPETVSAGIAAIVPSASDAIKVSIRLGLVFVGVMVALFVITIGLTFAGMWLFNDSAMTACRPDIPLSMGISVLVQIFGAIFAAGWFMTLAIERTPLRLRYTYLAGSFLSKNSAAYARWFNSILTRQGIAFEEAEDYFRYWNRAPLFIYKWPTIILFGVATLSLFLEPAICV